MGDKFVEIYDNLSQEINKNNLGIETKQEIFNEIVGEVQNKCLKSEFGQVVNAALDVGIKSVFPNMVSEQIINLKDGIYNNGIKNNLDETIEESVNIGKSIIGLNKDSFENLEQVQNAISEGKTVNKISDLVEASIDDLESSSEIDNNMVSELKKEKKTIIKNIEKNVEKSFMNQFKNIEKLEKYISNWNNYFEKQDFSGMEKEFNKMKKIMDVLLPMENTLTDYRIIENLQSLIKNNGKNFDLSEEEFELANKLIN